MALILGGGDGVIVSEELYCGRGVALLGNLYRWYKKYRDSI